MKTDRLPWMRELLASIVVFLVALPLCMGIAIASGVPPAMGLVAGVVGGLVVGSLAGSPLQVSGPAAGLAVLVWEIVNTHGVEVLAPIVMVAGLIQVASGFLGVGQWFRAVSPALVYGMLAGIGILIFGSQFHVMIDDSPQSNGLMNLLTIPQAMGKALDSSLDTPHQLAAGIGLLTLVVLVGWNLAKPHLPSFLRNIPAPLLAIAAAVTASTIWDLPISYVSVPQDASALFTLPELSSFAALLNPSLLADAIALAVIASAESLLCASAVDKLHDGPRTKFDRELKAQGIGNLLSGFLGGLPVTGVIVRSTANVEAGGTTRLPAIMHGLWLLVLVLAIPTLLGRIPTSALAAVLVYIGYKLVKPDVIKMLWARGKAEFAIYAITVSMIVATSLLEGLLVGFIVALLRMSYTVSQLQVDVKINEGRVDMHLYGYATFMRLPTLAKALEDIDENAEVHIHLEHLRYVDHACLELISDWEKQRTSRAGSLVMEWAVLEDKNQKPMSPRVDNPEKPGKKVAA